MLVDIHELRDAFINYLTAKHKSLDEPREQTAKSYYAAIEQGNDEAKDDFEEQYDFFVARQNEYQHAAHHFHGFLLTQFPDLQLDFKPRHIFIGETRDGTVDFNPRFFTET